MTDTELTAILAQISGLWPDAGFNPVLLRQWRDRLRPLAYDVALKAIQDHHADPERARKYGNQMPSVGAVLTLASGQRSAAAEYARRQERIVDQTTIDWWRKAEALMKSAPRDELDEWKRQAVEATDEPLAGWLRIRSYIPGDPKYSRTLVAKMVGMMESAVAKAGAA